MMLKHCLRCGTLSDQSYCPAHRRGGSTRAWRNTRETILRRDGYVCTAQGCTETEDLHVDHVHPVSDGGTDHPSNLTTLCSKHNLEKGKA